MGWQFITNYTHDLQQGRRKTERFFLKQSVGGKLNVFNKTPIGARFSDIISEGIAYEVKTGSVSLSMSNRMQVVKDMYLLKTGVVREVNWVFFKSPTTGKIGPTKPLRDLLAKSGIDIIYKID